MDDIKNYEAPEASTIYDRNWEVLYTAHWKENRKIIPFEQIKDDTIYAVIALEDVNFFEHKWVDLIWVFRAILGQLRLIEYKGWWSTLTQQFVKNRFLSNERTIIRKIKEMILSAQIENFYSKEEIVTMYLNQIPFWSSIYWLEQASTQFFWKSSNELTLAESVIVASVPNATTFYSPYWENKRTSLNNISLDEITKDWVDSYEQLLAFYWNDSLSYGLLPKEIVLNSWATVFYLPWRSSFALDNLVKIWYIDEEKKNKALRELFDYEFKELREDINAPHFVMYVRKIIEEKYWKEVLIEWGLKIITSLDLKLQNKAEEIVLKNALYNQENFDSENQSLLTLDTRNWEILTMVWSRDFFDKEIDGQVNVTRQKRLAGSTFKPFAYASMLLSWYSPSTIIFDTETDFWESGEEYIPQNFDWKFMWPMSIRKALWHSRNITAIKAWIVWWIQKTYDISKSLWIKFTKDANWYWASLPIWTVDVTAEELLSAYIVFANNWKKIESKPILKILTKNWTILEELKHDEKLPLIMDDQVAYQITDMLADKDSRWAWWNSRLQLGDRSNAVKTWTSNKRMKKSWNKDWKIMPLDWWTVGYTPQYATVVWSWNNNGAPMSVKASWWDVSAKTWHEFLSYLHEDLDVEDFEIPEGIKYIKVSRLSWKLPQKDTPSNLIENWVFAEINSPKEYDDSISFIEIDTVSKKLPTAFTPEEAITKTAILEMHSLRIWSTKWEDPVIEWLEKNWESFLKKSWITSVLSKSPESSDDVHTRKNTGNKPVISIISPKPWSFVSKKWFSVMPDVSVEYRILKLEYYLDWELVDTQYDYPYKWEIKLDEDFKIWFKYNIKILAYDSLYNVWKKEFEVEIWKDDIPPFTEIVKPENSQKLIAWSTYELKTLSYDIWSDISKLVFYLNDKEVGTVKNAPFALFFEVPKMVWEHNLKVIAYDKTWNKSEDEITFESIRKSSDIWNGITIELDNKIIALSPAEIQLLMPYSKFSEIEKIEVVARYTSLTWEDKEDIISLVDNFDWNSTWVFYLTWQSPQKWEYLVYAKQYYKNKKVLKSRKVSVDVR